MKKLLKKKDLIILLVLIVILISLIPFYILKIRDIIYSNKFATYSYETYTNYTNPIFSIEKIVYYSNAFVTDNSSDGNFQNINIGQYTDIAIYINNTNASELTKTEVDSKNNTYRTTAFANIKITSGTYSGQTVAIPFIIEPLKVEASYITVPKNVAFNESYKNASDYKVTLTVVAKDREGKKVQKTLAADDFTVKYDWEKTEGNVKHNNILSTVTITNKKKR